jgi:hypothetical protein
MIKYLLVVYPIVVLAFHYLLIPLNVIFECAISFPFMIYNFGIITGGQFAWLQAIEFACFLCFVFLYIGLWFWLDATCKLLSGEVVVRND